MPGLIVHGDNHFVVRGPEPEEAIVKALVREWSLIQIGRECPAELRPWQISTREFRDQLEWAYVVNVPGRVPTAAVAQLLKELSEKSVPVRTIDNERATI